MVGERIPCSEMCFSLHEGTFKPFKDGNLNVIGRHLRKQSWMSRLSKACELSLWTSLSFSLRFLSNSVSVPPPLHSVHYTNLASTHHPFCVTLASFCTNRHASSSFTLTSSPWKSLPSSVFPTSIHLQQSMSQVHHLDLI